MRRRALVLLALSMFGAGPVAGADPWTEARGLALERDALGLRHDLDRRSAGVHGGVGRLGRDVRAMRPRPSKQNPALERLDRRLLDLERDADRLRDRRRLELSLERRVIESGVPEAYRPPWPEDIRGRDRLIGVGKLVVRVQRSLRQSAVELTARHRELASRHLADAEAGLARLERGLARADPNIAALRAETVRLRALLGD